MSDSKPELTLDQRLAALQELTVEERLAALELQVFGIRADLAAIREVIDSEHEHFAWVFASKDRVVDAIIDRLDLIEDRLEPAFINAFPDYGRCLLEISKIVDGPRKR